jgi:hypothetical protein
MRVVSVLTASILVLACVACASGGGPSDLSLGGGTTLPALTTTTLPRTTTSAPFGGERVLAARARFARLAVYASPDAAKPMRVLENPWTPKGAPRERITQVLLVESRRPDGWVKVLLPDTPEPKPGWVRAFDVKLSAVPYRVRVSLSRHRMTAFRGDETIFAGPIRVTEEIAIGTKPGRFYVRRIEPGRANGMTPSPYVYRFIARLASRVPLGTPVDILR